MDRTSTSRCGLLLLIGLSGCAAQPQKEQVLPHGDATMLDVWNQYGAGAARVGPHERRLLDARQSLRRPLTEEDHLETADSHIAYTRTAANEIYSQFHRLPNPDLVMYVFPHLAGTERVPVPGYSTVFPLYERVHYALPGERTEDY